MLLCLLTWFHQDPRRHAETAGRWAIIARVSDNVLLTINSPLQRISYMGGLYYQSLNTERQEPTIKRSVLYYGPSQLETMHVLWIILQQGTWWSRAAFLQHLSRGRLALSSSEAPEANWLRASPDFPTTWLTLLLFGWVLVTFCLWWSEGMSEQCWFGAVSRPQSEVNKYLQGNRLRHNTWTFHRVAQWQSCRVRARLTGNHLEEKGPPSLCSQWSTCCQHFVVI